MAKLSGYICDRLAVPILALGASGRRHSYSLMSARAFVAVVLAWESESAARVIRAGRVGVCRGWDWLCLCELLPFVCPGLPGLARPDSAQAGPDGRGVHGDADQRWRRDGR